MQGTALGIFGLGLLGQSLAVFGGPVAASAFGWQSVFRGVGVALLVWAVVFAPLRATTETAARPASVAAMLRVLRHEPIAWWLGRVLLPDLRRLRRVLDLPADAVAIAVSA